MWIGRKGWWSWRRFHIDAHIVFISCEGCGSSLFFIFFMIPLAVGRLRLEALALKLRNIT
jgi:hypothetical protein